MAKVLYTAQATVTGGRAKGHGRTDDGVLEVDLRMPTELGGEGLSQAHSLQQASQRHSLRRVGTAAILFRGNSSVI